MAMIDRVKFDGLKSRDWIIYKHPSESLTMGTQLIVGEGQAAVFVKSGRVLDMFNPGTYMLRAENLPLLQGFLNLPFGGKTPFTAEVYFVNTTSKLDLHWGTSDPIQLVDPKYFTRLRVRAFGQMGLRIANYPQFFTQLIGAMNLADVVRYDKVIDFYRGMLVTKVKATIADIILNQKISALEIAAHLDDISEQVRTEVTPEFARFGFSVVNFFVQSINFPEEDFEKINKILEDKAAFEIIGDSRYVTKRSFDVYESAAGNENGIAGAFAAGGMGIGAGAAVGAGIGAASPLDPLAAVKKAKTCPRCGAGQEPGDKFCSECGSPLVQSMKCRRCGAVLEDGDKFCSKCGEPVSQKKCECGEPLDSGDKFCPGCGKKVGDST